MSDSTVNHNPMNDPYTDDSLMPFGQHKGKKLEDVPARYFLEYLEPAIKEIFYKRRTLVQNKLLAYIDDNKQVLQKQAKNNQ